MFDNNLQVSPSPWTYRIIMPFLRNSWNQTDVIKTVCVVQFQFIANESVQMPVLRISLQPTSVDAFFWSNQYPDPNRMRFINSVCRLGQPTKRLWWIWNILEVVVPPLCEWIFFMFRFTWAYFSIDKTEGKTGRASFNLSLIVSLRTFKTLFVYFEHKLKLLKCGRMSFVTRKIPKTAKQIHRKFFCKNRVSNKCYEKTFEF